MTRAGTTGSRRLPQVSRDGNCRRDSGHSVSEVNASKPAVHSPWLQLTGQTGSGTSRPYADHASFGDPAFIGSYALNMLDQSNWAEVDGGLGYRSPPAKAAHLAKLEESRLND